ncbi:MAG TPA: MotA/TolQ/ExbB proton channel family protein [Solimonas sp.]
MKRVVAGMLVAVLLGMSAGATAQTKALDELLRQVREGGAQSAKINQEREARFLKNRNEQQALVQKAESDLATARGRADAVRARFDANQKAIADLKAQLRNRAGDYTQVYAIVRQAAGDFRAVAADSLLSAQFPERMQFLDELAASNELPSLPQLETLWFTLQQELTEGGKVQRFGAEIIGRDGARREAQIVRVGAFTAFADGEYLALTPGQTLLQALPSQPGGGWREMARDFADSGEATAPILVDPTRGTLLMIEGEKPGLGERIRQGGSVGYIIIAIGVAGLLIAGLQLLYLEAVGRRVRAQLDRLSSPRDDNPLGRVLATFGAGRSADDEDPELLELKLSEAVLRETPALERGQSLLRLFVAVAPLLGLLGTVTGMIVTFQAITVFGTGDPRLMADGISQALVTTVQGLVVAIPLLFVNSLLAVRSRTLIQVLDEQSAALLGRRLEAGRA